MIAPVPQSDSSTSSADHGHGNYSSISLWLTAASGALGGLLFGYDWVVIGGAKPFYELYFHLNSPYLQGWAMSCALIGCLAGSAVAGTLSDRFGRKRLLRLAAFVFAISSLGTGIAAQFASFVVWRILGGCAIGLASGISPMYIAEISPAHVRGRLVSLNQMAIVIGILMAQVVNWLIARPVPFGATSAEILASWNGQFGWRWMFAVTALPAALFLITTFLIPESPRWLASKKREQEAFAILEKLSGPDYARHVLEEFRSTTSLEPRASILRELAMPGVARALLLGIALAILQQWCGINVVFNYAQEIFAAAGYQISGILFNIVITGAVNVVFTAMALITVDRLGRRFLLLMGAAGLALIYIVLGAFYHMHLHGLPMLILVLAAIACYAISLAPATWVVISEIFPNHIRGRAVSIAVTCLWIACFVLTYTFPALNAALSTAGVFWTYAAICVAGLLYLYFRLPETRGRSLEEIEADLLSGKL
ncbi:MAG TPA: sugar porter family MFS transporter [Terracidiphilus sp.]|nr:sugar porter family MFS transporter [Terracidiphilus sp.]